MNIPIGNINSQANAEEFDRSYEEHCAPQDLLADMFFHFLLDGGTISDCHDVLNFLESEKDGSDNLDWAYDTLDNMILDFLGREIWPFELQGLTLQEAKDFPFPGAEDSGYSVQYVENEMASYGRKPNGSRIAPEGTDILTRFSLTV